MTLSSSSRDSYIDFLRGLGLLLLVVAHTNPQEWLFQFRSFDVPLMVFISAMCYKPLRGGINRVGEWFQRKINLYLSRVGTFVM